MHNQNDELLRAPSSVGRYIEFDASRRGNKMLNSSRDKNEGTYSSGEGGEGPKCYVTTDLSYYR